MDKRALIQVLEEIALLLEIKGENPFKIKAYSNAARAIEVLEGDIEDYIREGRLHEIKGIGKAITGKLEEYWTHGRLRYYEELKRSVPEGLLEMLRIPGVGPRKAKLLYERLGVKTVGELEYACIENRLLDLEGFGRKTQENILKGIEALKKYAGRHLSGEVWDTAAGLKAMLLSSGTATACEVAGSLRRGKEIIKDIDLVAGTKAPLELMDYFTALPMVEEVVAKGDTKSSVRLKSGINVDLRAVKPEDYPYALNHFTGSREHNTAMRHRAKAMGIKINEYGLFRDELRIECRSEEDIYKAIGLSYIPPELRENMGELEAAESGNLPELLTLQDIRGTFHMHTVYSDGSDTIEGMVEEAMKAGLSYIGISDHSRSAFYARGLNADEIERQLEEIDRLNARLKAFRIFKGIESDILPDGSLDYDEGILARFDFVIASVHSSFKLEKSKMTDRLKRALQNKYTTMLGHLTGRILLAREEYELDIHEVIDAAAACGKIIEINSDPHRMDLDWRFMRYAKEKGVLMSVNPDAHNRHGLHNIRFGVGLARKGWLEKHNVVNTMDLEQITAFLGKMKA